MQRLILPINQAKLTASWKTEAYLLRFGSAHYGADMVSREGRRTVYASGDGRVVAVGADSVVGNVVSVCYTGAYNRVDGTVQDVVFRYFHLGRMDVREGQPVNKDSVLGLYGNTGLLAMAMHLHLEADTDVRYPLYSPTVLRSNFIKGRALGANDLSMCNPLYWLFVKESAPDLQSFHTAGDSFISAEDKRLPALEG